MAAEVGSFVNAGGIKTRYHEEGHGPHVLLLHGSGPGVSAGVNWAGTIQTLKNGYHVLAPDIVGFGSTEQPKGYKYGVDAWVNHVLGFLDALGIERANVIGNSMGGRIALDIAARFPDRIDRLILMGVRAPGTNLSDGLRAVRAYKPGLENMRVLLETFFAYDRSLVTDTLVRARYEASARPGAQETYERMFADQASNDLPLTDDDVRAISHRVLIAHGRDDLVIPFENALRLFGLLPNAELHGFGNCGHWVQFEHAAAFGRLVMQFLAG